MLGLERQKNQQKTAFEKLQADKDLVIFDESVGPGTAIFMTFQANEYTQHTVQPTECEESGSVVSRSISTVIPLDHPRINTA